MTKEIDYRGIDVKLRPIIAELNAKGFKTEFSCAGHKYRNTDEFDEGCIRFQGLPSQAKVREIFKAHGINNVAVLTEKRISTTFSFPGLGGTKAYYKDKLDYKKFQSLAGMPRDDFGLLNVLFSRNLSRLGIHHASNTANVAYLAFRETLGGREVPKNYLKHKAELEKIY